MAVRVNFFGKFLIGGKVFVDFLEVVCLSKIDILIVFCAIVITPF